MQTPWWIIGSILEFLKEVESGTKKSIEVERTRDPDRHVLAWEILSPRTTRQVVASIPGFPVLLQPGRE
jgi:hypothetical protein